MFNVKYQCAIFLQLVDCITHIFPYEMVRILHKYLGTVKSNKGLTCAAKEIGLKKNVLLMIIGKFLHFCSKKQHSKNGSVFA